MLDNLTPEHLWPADASTWPDALRERWLGGDDLVSTELLTAPESSIVAVKRQDNPREELLPGRPPVVGARHERAGIEELDTGLETQLLG